MNFSKLFIFGFASTIAFTGCLKQEARVLKKDSNTSNIIGGTDVMPQDSLSQSIVAVYNKAEGDLCTGTLLPNNIVVTAAHCLSDNVSDMVIYFESMLTEASVEYSVDKVSVSPYWRSRRFKDTNTGDIALLHFTGKAPERFVPAELLSSANSKTLNIGQEVFVAGFGTVNGSTFEGAGSLRKTTVKILDLNYSISESLIDQSSGSGVCHGDSGGPAFVKIQDTYYLWGVIARGANDPESDCNNSAAMTMVEYYRVWIERMSEKLSESLTNPRF